MNFVSRADIEAPIDYVFEAVSDFAGFEKAALRRGAEVVRTDRMAGPGPGMQWDTVFRMRDKPRRVTIGLERFVRPSLLQFDAESKNINGAMAVELLELSRRHTRVTLRLQLKPSNLTARIMLQSLRLAKARLSARLQLRVDGYAREIEERFRRGLEARAGSGVL